MRAQTSAPSFVQSTVLCRYIDSRAENGLTALHLAAVTGSLTCVQALLAAGADMMMQTIDQGINSIFSLTAGSTVLHAAVESSSVSIVQVLLQVRVLSGSDGCRVWLIDWVVAHSPKLSFRAALLFLLAFDCSADASRDFDG